MDALILRVALLLCLAPSAVARMQATDVLALAVADARAREAAMTTEALGAIRNAGLINLAVFAPEKLGAEEQKIRDRAGLTVKPQPIPAALEAALAALPLEG